MTEITQIIYSIKNQSTTLFVSAAQAGRGNSVVHPAVWQHFSCHTTVPWLLCSPVMCLLKWKQVIEWDNLKTQGLGLLLATILSEERRFSHCLLSLFLRANTQAQTCTQKYLNPLLRLSTYSDAHTAAVPQPEP